MNKLILVPTMGKSKLWATRGLVTLTMWGEHGSMSLGSRQHLLVTDDSPISEGDAYMWVNTLTTDFVEIFNKENLKKIQNHQYVGDVKKVVASTDYALTPYHLISIEDQQYVVRYKRDKCGLPALELKYELVPDNDNHGDGQIFHNNRKEVVAAENGYVLFNWLDKDYMSIEDIDCLRKREKEPEIYNDDNESMFNMAELREICNGFASEIALKHNFSDATGFWDYLKNSKFNYRIRKNAKTK